MNFILVVGFVYERKSKERLIQLKNPGEIVRQAVGNSKYVEELTGEPLIPPSVTDVNSLGSLSEAIAKEHFGTERYGFLVEVMRSDLAGQDLDEEKEWEMGRRLKVLNGVDRYITNHYISEENGVLYPKQMEVFKTLGRFLQNGGIEGYFKLPTAFGKTVVFTEFAKAANLRTLVVVPTIEVLDQTEGTFTKLAPELELGKVYAQAKDFLGKITVTTYDSLLRLVDPPNDDAEGFDFLPEDIDLLILDEAHHALGPRAQQAVSQFINAIKLGFTATPFYSESRNLGRLLGTEIYGMSIKEAAEEELLSPFKVWLAVTNSDLSGVEIDASTEDYNPAQLARVVNTTSINQGAVNLYEEYFIGKSTLVNCVSVKHAQQVARLFRESGIKAEAVWGDMNKAKRNSLIEAFKKGDIAVLCNMQLLTEGFDAPSASVCINLRPTLSAVVAEQRGGRTLRLDPADPNKEATIVDFIYKEKSDRQQVSFAEVAETASVPSKLQGQIEAAYFERERGKVPTSPSSVEEFTIGEFKVITEITEVMRVASQAKMSREQDIATIPDGFIMVPITQILREYSIIYPTLQRYLRLLVTASPQDFLQKEGRGKIFVTAEGLASLSETLEPLRIPSGFSQVTQSVLANEYELSYVRVKRVVDSLSETHPQDIRRRGSIKSNRLLITQEGLRLLKDALGEIRDIREKFEVIDIKQVAEDFGRGVTFSMARKMFYKLAKQHPDHFLKHYAKGQSYSVSPEGMKFLQEGLEKLIIPDGYVQVDLKALASEYGIDTDTIYHRILLLFDEQSKHVIRRGQGVPNYLTEQGMAIIRNDLEAKRNLVEIPFKELTEGLVGAQLTYVVGKLRAFISKHPEYFIQKKLEGQKIPRIYVSRVGLEMLKAEREMMKIPKGHLLLKLQKLAREYRKTRPTISAYVEELSKNYPGEFERMAKGGPIYVTERGMNLVTEGLKEFKVPEGFSIINAAQLADDYNVGLNTVYRYIESLRKAGYSSELVRRGEGGLMTATTLGLSLLEEKLGQKLPGNAKKRQ